MKKLLIISTLLFLSFIVQIALPETTHAANSTPPINKRVYLLIFDPVLQSQGGVRVSEYMNYRDVDTLTGEAISAISQATEGRVKYTITKTDYSNDYLVKEDGFLYNEATYLQCLNNTSTCHEPAWVNYSKMISDYGLCDRYNAGEFDELWLFAGPYWGFYESNLAGPGAFWFNSPATLNTSCSKLLPIMGYNFEREYEMMIHNYGHRAESALAKIYGNWTFNNQNPVTKWDKFSTTTHLASGQPMSGCGNVHFPPNGTSDYDYSNTRTVTTFCNSFPHSFDEANPTANSTSTNCSAWGCTGGGYYIYWLNKLSHTTGYDSRGITNDWWRLVFDPNFIFSSEAKNIQTTQPIPAPQPTIPPEPEFPETPESPPVEPEIEEKPVVREEAEENTQTTAPTEAKRSIESILFIILGSILFIEIGALIGYIYLTKRKSIKNIPHNRGMLKAKIITGKKYG